MLRPPQAQRSSPTLLPNVTPSRLRCACGKFDSDYALLQSGKWSTKLHSWCKACHLKDKPPRCRYLKHGSMETDPPPLDLPFIAAALASFSAHPRLDSRIYLPSGCGHFNIGVAGPVIDFCAQVCLLPEYAIHRFPTPTPCCDPTIT